MRRRIGHVKVTFAGKKVQMSVVQNISNYKNKFVLNSFGERPVKRLKYLPKNEGSEKFIKEETCAIL